MSQNIACQKETQSQRPEYVLLGVLLCAACLYLPFRSVSLDDFDAYSFVLALDHFSLDLQQPQPPGFPVYVFLGRGLYALTHQARTALTLLSALSAVGVVGLTFALGHLEQQGMASGLIAALFVGLLPMHWLTAGKALSDMPGLFWTLLALWLLLKGRGHTPWLAAGGFVTGIALGVRPQNALPLILFWGYEGGRSLLRKSSLRPLIYAGLCCVIAILLWLIPLAQSTGGVLSYLVHIQTHAAHVGQADSLLGTGMPFVVALRARALMFGDTFLTAIMGVGLFAPWRIGDALRLTGLALIVVPALIWTDWRRAETWALLIWFWGVTAQIFVFETLDRPRLMLPMLPPLALLIARGWARIHRPRWLPTLMMCATCLALLVQGAPLAAQLASVAAPPAQAAAYVAAHYEPGQTLIATAGSFRAVQVELPAYRQVYLYRFDGEAVQASIASGVRYIVVFDRDQFPGEVMDILSAEGHFVPLEDRMFARDRRVHTQHDQVRVQVLTPADLIPPDALTLPSDGCVDIGGENDGRYLAQGWFRPEDIGGVSGRWAGELITSTVRLAIKTSQAYTVQFRALAYPAEQVVTLYVDQQVIAQVPLSQTWTEHVVSLPAGALTPDDTVTLSLVHAAAQSPFEQSAGGSSDTRPLSAAYDWICVRPSP